MTVWLGIMVMMFVGYANALERMRSSRDPNPDEFTRLLERVRDPHESCADEVMRLVLDKGIPVDQKCSEINRLIRAGFRVDEPLLGPGEDGPVWEMIIQYLCQGYHTEKFWGGTGGDYHDDVVPLVKFFCLRGADVNDACESSESALYSVARVLYHRSDHFHAIKHMKNACLLFSVLLDQGAPLHTRSRTLRDSVQARVSSDPDIHDLWKAHAWCRCEHIERAFCSVFPVNVARKVMAIAGEYVGENFAVPECKKEYLPFLYLFQHGRFPKEIIRKSGECCLH